LSETVLPNFHVASWNMLFGPARPAGHDPQTIERRGKPAAEADAFFEQELIRWKHVIDVAGIKLDGSGRRLVSRRIDLAGVGEHSRQQRHRPPSGQGRIARHRQQIYRSCPQHFLCPGQKPGSVDRHLLVGVRGLTIPRAPHNPQVNCPNPAPLRQAGLLLGVPLSR
jgi:hypothetical protein